MDRNPPIGEELVDGDLECLRPLDDVLDGEDFVGVCHKPGRITNTMIASVAKHPLLEQALEQVRPMDMYWTGQSGRLKEVAGPRMLERLVSGFPDVKLLEPALCFPSTPEELESAITIHHMARTWHNTTTLRSAMLRAEKRLEAAKAELAAEKRAHSATKKRLAKLEARGDDSRVTSVGSLGRNALDKVAESAGTVRSEVSRWFNRRR